MAPIDATGWVMAGLLAILDLVLVGVIFHKELDERTECDDALARAERELPLKQVGRTRARGRSLLERSRKKAT